jgi:hypothetical protein
MSAPGLGYTWISSATLDCGFPQCSRPFRMKGENGHLIRVNVGSPSANRKIHMSLSVVIPAFNEDEKIGSVVDELHSVLGKRLNEVIVVDDGSEDTTAEVAHAHGATVYRLSKHVGYGKAIKVGIQKAKSQYIVTVDGDGQHDPRDIPKLYKVRGVADLVIGDRGSLASSGMWRGMGKLLLWRLAEYLTGQRIRDLNSGMKLGKTKDLRALSRLCPNGMSFSDTLTLVYLSEGASLEFVPIVVRNRTAGKSTIGLRTAFETAISIVNVVMLFGPTRIFLPISFFLVCVGILWATPIAISGRGLSVGGLLLILVGALTFFFGITAEQVSQLRKESIGEPEFLSVEERRASGRKKRAKEKDKA